MRRSAMTSFVLSPATVAALELDELLALVRLHAGTDLGRARLANLEPAHDESELRGRRNLLLETIAHGPFVPSSERPFQPVLDALASTTGEIDGSDVVLLGDLLRTGDDAARSLREADEVPPTLATLTELPDLSDVRKAIDRVFDARGRIRPDASPRLVAARERARSSRDRLYRDLGRILGEHAEHFGEDTVPLRGGRLVVLLKSGSKGRIPGLVHGRSGSGRNFYFEPLETVDANNDLSEALDEEEEEKRRLLGEIVRDLRQRADDVLAIADVVGHLDQLQAIARFGDAVDGRLVDLAPEGSFRLVAARHPLLDPRLAESRREALGSAGHEGEVVPLDLELDDERLLVVTGPNAGGKTVALKTLGLLALAHQCGLPIPVGAGSRLPTLAGVVATVGDDQDLLADRSTFSGRLLRLAEAWKVAGPGVLVLLDELGSGTDPEEGAALSISLVEELVRRGTPALVTTHLVAVAASALELDGAACGAMAFEAASGEPTYRLVPGPPGGSEALALGRRLGLPATWLDRAEALLGPGHRQLQRLLSEVEQIRGDLAQERERLATEIRDAETLRRRLAEEERALVEERREIEDRLRGELRAFRREVRSRLEDEVEKVREAAREGRRKHVAREAADRALRDAPIDDADPEPTSDRAPETGDPVRHRLLGWTGVLVSLDRGRATVDARGKTLHCKLGELVLDPTATTHERPVRETAKGLRTTAAASTPEVGRELELIGKRVEPALAELDRYLDRALLASHDRLRVVHGHGTGRLRKAVRAHLQKHAAVAESRPGDRDEGGDAVTIVRLRGA